MDGSLRDELYQLRFNVNRSIRYHNRRRAFYDRFNDTSSAIALIFGSASLFVLLRDGEVSNLMKAIPPVIVTVVSSLNLVMGSARMARQHHDLARRFIALEAQLTVNPPADMVALAKYCADRLMIEQDEPPVLRVLDTLCYNETARALGHKNLIPVRWYQRLFSPFFDIQQHALESK